jgi:hypothetical protein
LLQIIIAIAAVAACCILVTAGLAIRMEIKMNSRRKI